MSAEDFRSFVTSTKQPAVIKNKLDWQLLGWDLNKWTRVIGDTKLRCRQGRNAYTKEPQYENSTESVEVAGFEQFLRFGEEQPEKWLYFDYKYLREWFTNVLDLQNISWKNFGFPELSAADSTIWIGTKGAHTPCHTDAYGCNLVAQIYGRKRWMLFPPETDLRPTRLPYEDSSIYSRVNFFSPPPDAASNELRAGCCYSTVLNPGEVLVVPHGWWHYVENTETAISVNTWIRLPIDDERRLEESIVRTLVAAFCNNLDRDARLRLLNPVSIAENVCDETLQNNLALIQHCRRTALDGDPNEPNAQTCSSDSQKMVENVNVCVIGKLSREEFVELLERQGGRFARDDADKTTAEEWGGEREMILSAFLHPDVIRVIKSKLLIREHK